MRLVIHRPTAASPGTITAMTQPGVILGTAAYMSPEQARGKSVDHRADIWAFGVVLFGMLSGRPVFEGETVSDTLAGVLDADEGRPVSPGRLRLRPWRGDFSVEARLHSGRPDGPDHRRVWRRVRRT